MLGVTVLNIYFDTNIYCKIVNDNESKLIKHYLKENDIKVLTSQSNVVEILVIPDVSRKYQELNCLVDLSGTYERKPQSWVHSYELRNEIRRCRPHWLTKCNDNTYIQYLLNAHKNMWRDIKNRLKIPKEEALQIYRRDSESGIETSRVFQKTLKEMLMNISIEKSDWENIDLSNPEMFWRVECLCIWYNAVVYREAASRDYYDWLSPFLILDSFKDYSYVDFWMKDIDGNNIPHNRLASLVSLYQLDKKITHGNAYDQIHAGHLLDSDLFFTADQRFYETLVKVITNHFPGLTEPIFIDMNNGSGYEQIKRAIESL